MLPEGCKLIFIYALLHTHVMLMRSTQYSKLTLGRLAQMYPIPNGAGNTKKTTNSIPMM